MENLNTKFVKFIYLQKNNMTIMKKNKVKLIVNDSNNLILNKLRKKTEVILLKIKKIRK